MYYTVIKHSGHLRTLEKCRKHRDSPEARVVYISLVFSNARRVLSQCNTRLRLLYLLNMILFCGLFFSILRCVFFFFNMMLSFYFVLSFLDHRRCGHRLHLLA